ncbi:MAG: hypothetical protein JW790_02300 [Dehalococcoidales bacterium]|nr:hypothetical protein [Dehalococcoidales bacterium]
MSWEPVLTVNFALCITIFVLGMVGYAKKKGTAPVCIGVAFLLFAVSHLLTILGLAAGLTAALIGIRVTAYALVVVAMCRILRSK